MRADAAPSHSLRVTLAGSPRWPFRILSLPDFVVIDRAYISSPQRVYIYPVIRSYNVKFQPHSCISDLTIVFPV